MFHVTQRSPEKKVTWNRTWNNLSTIDLHRMILIDPEVLSCLGCQLPDRPLHLMSFSNESSSSQLMIIHKAYDDPQKDFFTVQYGNETRAVAKFKMVPFEVDGRQFLVPEDVERFLWSWERSRFIRCLGLDMGRKEKKDFQEVVAGVARFRSLAAAHGVTLTLNCGSLLGWYRECSIIPHTSDLDFTINSEEHSANFMRAMETSEEFKLSYTLAEPSGCFQFKACLLGTKTKLDVFYLYKNDSLSWTCGSLDDFRVVWWYPPTMEFCTGELLGTLVYVPCAVEEHLEVSRYRLARNRNTLLDQLWEDLERGSQIQRLRLSKWPFERPSEGKERRRTSLDDAICRPLLVKRLLVGERA
uniref:Fukutin n=1 Tax=Steinernema glaseri TaxID=37863 RepID=A0A1I7Z1M6_9BILA